MVPGRLSLSLPLKLENKKNSEPAEEDDFEGDLVSGESKIVLRTRRTEKPMMS